MSVGVVSVRGMEPRLSLITLGVPDVARARAFYVDGLGWQPLFEVPGEVVFIQVGHGLTLSLFGAAALARDVDPDGAGVPAAAPAGVTLAHNVGSEAEVDTALADAVRAGGRLVKEARRAEWGGYHGYFADPAGTLWEVAFNPSWSVAADGAVTI